MEPTLKSISDDLNFIKNELISLREEIDSLKEIRPEYIKKVEALDKSGKFTSFSSVSDLRKAIEHV